MSISDIIFITTAILALIILLAGGIVAIKTGRIECLLMGSFMAIAIWIFGNICYNYVYNYETETETKALVEEENYKVYLDGQEISLNTVNLEDYKVIVDKTLGKIILTKK